uniref:hypothetical protein n=1 Tax=Paracoccus mutanolyticus TaxID=1499308 RepID=UPI001674EE1E
MALQPIHDLIRAHVLGAEAIMLTTRPIRMLAHGTGTQTARLWTYLRDDRPFVRAAPPAAGITSQPTAGKNTRPVIWRAGPAP